VSGDHAGCAASDDDDVNLNGHVEHVIESSRAALQLFRSTLSAAATGSQQLPGALSPVTSTMTMDAECCRDELAAGRGARRTPLTPLTIVYPDIDVVDAYEIQLINIRQRVAEGARVGPQGRVQ
jgi:hypothetical protein